MILNKNDKETDSFLDINNDITRILKIMNENQELKKLLKITTKKPLQYKAEITEDFRDKQIARQPILPFDENEGSVITVTLISADEDMLTDTLMPSVAIDIFTPGNQWIINEGVRPLQIAHVVSNLMKHDMQQTGGVKYRCTAIVNAQLSDVLCGYRMIYEAIIDD